MSELKLCPFCGGEAEILTFWDFYKFSCRNADCTAHVADAPYVQHAEGVWYGSIDEARAAWNTRADYHGYEQAAIEAWESIKAWNTRAERTCHNKAMYGNFKCDVCNAFLQLADFDEEPMLTVDGVGYVPDYCPHCGAKVVGE